MIGTFYLRKTRSTWWSLPARLSTPLTLSPMPCHFIFVSNFWCHVIPTSRIKTMLHLCHHLTSQLLKFTIARAADLMAMLSTYPKITFANSSLSACDSSIFALDLTNHQAHPFTISRFGNDILLPPSSSQMQHSLGSIPSRSSHCSSALLTLCLRICWSILLKFPFSFCTVL